jgi:hypothetical protein
MSKVMYPKGSMAGCAKSNSRTGRPKSWTVCLDQQDYMVHRIIYILLYGYIEDGYVIDHLDGNPFNNTHSNLAVKTVKHNSQNICKKTNNTSGITGVGIIEVKGRNITHTYWTAQWRDLSGKACAKHFSIAKLGYETAKALAISHRNEQITLLNAAGASYTERHLGITPETTPVSQPTI